MHRTYIPHYAQRLLEQRGSPRRFLEGLDPTRCAFLVVDMQRGFVEPKYRFAIPLAREIVPAINRLAEPVRSAGGKVVWIRTNFRGEEKRWSAWFRHFLQPQVAAEMISCFSPGSPGYELFGDLRTDAQDLQIDKSRFSPFVPGASDLHARLERDGIDTLIIGGTVTNTCCETTARDAMMLNYKVLFLSDANAARTDEEHNATLGNIAQTFGDVVSVDDVLKQLSSKHA